LTKIKKIGHAGTLDPFATGLMVMLIGKGATSQQERYLSDDKGYRVTIKLGEATDTFDTEGKITHTSSKVPTLEEIQEVLRTFQGEIDQIPPMYSAKKIDGQKLYELARKGITIDRKPCKVRVSTTLLSYTYPRLILQIACSKGTYIRSIAHDLGKQLGSYGHATELTRHKSGLFSLQEAISVETLLAPEFSLKGHLIPCKSQLL
jgi:tRNA pseudouridine55 synthase